MYDNLPVLSVAQLNQYISDMLGSVKFAVKGEISGYRVSQQKWVTFDLKDENSKIACFTTTFKQFAPLEDGMEVICYGSARIYVPYGRYSFNIDAIELVGEGALQKAFLATKSKLEKEGLFLEEHKKQIPKFPKTIGIITSEQAAAYTDFLKIVNNRWAGVSIYLKPSLVQGVNAPEQLCAAIEYFNKYKKVDVLVITRGGGSLEDLQAFNNEDLARAVFSSNIPIVSAVGHERDITLIDLVSDIRASTPSNAAEIVVPDKQEFLQGLDYFEGIMERFMESHLFRYEEQLNSFLAKLDAVYKRKKQDFSVLEKRFFQGVKMLAYQAEQKNLSLKAKEGELERLLKDRLTVKKNKLQYFEKILTGLSPKTLLKKGYAIATHKKTGKIIKDKEQVQWGDELMIEVGNGNIAAIAAKKGNK